MADTLVAPNVKNHTAPGMQDGPEGIKALVRMLFAEIHIISLELQDCAAKWTEPRSREMILELVRRTESEPSLLGASSHLMAIARKVRA